MPLARQWRESQRSGAQRANEHHTYGKLKFKWQARQNAPKLLHLL